MRAFSVRAVALAIDVPTKWLDNLLSHHAVPGVVRSARGVERRIGEEALAVITVVSLLNRHLDISLARSVELAASVVEGNTPTSATKIVTSSGIALEVPLDAIMSHTRERLVDALEATAHIRRGRRPSRRIQE